MQYEERLRTEVCVLKNHIDWDSFYVCNNVTCDSVTNSKTQETILKNDFGLYLRKEKTVIF